MTGPRANREWREQKEANIPFADTQIAVKIAACKIAITKIFENFSIFAQEDILRWFTKLDGSNPETARDSVLSWICLVEPLISTLPHGTTVGYTPADFKAALNTLDDQALGDFLWATDRKWIQKTPRGKSIDRLMALALARALKRRGHAAKKVDEAMHTAFGIEWDSIRKWEGQVRHELGDETVDNVFGLVDAEDLFPVSGDWLLAQPFIHTAGSAYRRGIGIRHLPEMKDSDSYQQMLDRLHYNNATDGDPSDP